jgi:hypothetical protein
LGLDKAFLLFRGIDRKKRGLGSMKKKRGLGSMKKKRGQVEADSDGDDANAGDPDILI